jgi:hypothetical protein
MNLRRPIILVLCAVLLLLAYLAMHSRARPPSEQGLESTFAFPTTLDGVRQLEKQGMEVSIDKRELTGPACPPHALCLSRPPGEEFLSAEVHDRKRGAQVARLSFDLEGRFQWGWVHHGGTLHELEALRSPLIPRRVVVETRRTPAASWKDVAWGQEEAWEAVPLLPQVDLLPDYHRAWETGTPQVRAQVATEVLRLYQDDAVPFLREHLTTPAELEAVHLPLLSWLCAGQPPALSPPARKELLALFANEPTSAATLESFGCAPEHTDSQPLPEEEPLLPATDEPD